MRLDDVLQGFRYQRGPYNIATRHLPCVFASRLQARKACQGTSGQCHGIYCLSNLVVCALTCMRLHSTIWIARGSSSFFCLFLARDGSKFSCEALMGAVDEVI